MQECDWKSRVYGCRWSVNHCCSPSIPSSMVGGRFFDRPSSCLTIVPGLKIHYLRRLMEKKKEIVMSGIRPTGFLHLGNYFGAIRNYIKMQEDFDCFFMVADLHSLTTHPDTQSLKSNVHRVLAENIACGLDPDK